LTAANTLRIPGIHDAYTRGLEVRSIPRDYLHAMHHRPEIKRFSKKDSLRFAETWTFSVALALEIKFFQV
jgi:hypothetical protein